MICRAFLSGGEGARCPSHTPVHCRGQQFFMVHGIGPLGPTPRVSKGVITKHIRTEVTDPTEVSFTTSVGPLFPQALLRLDFWGSFQQVSPPLGVGTHMCVHVCGCACVHVHMCVHACACVCVSSLSSPSPPPGQFYLVLISVVQHALGVSCPKTLSQLVFLSTSPPFKNSDECNALHLVRPPFNTSG